jgi:hypothetical protein
MYCYTPLDLHALATPPAFTVSQDQTLQLFVITRVTRPEGLSLVSLQNEGLPIGKVHQRFHDITAGEVR